MSANATRYSRTSATRINHYRRMVGLRPSQCQTPRASWLSFEEDKPERRHGERQRVVEAVHRARLGVDAAAVAHVAAAVERAVAVEQLAVPAALGHADAVVGPRHGREVRDDDREVLRVRARGG